MTYGQLALIAYAGITITILGWAICGERIRQHINTHYRR